LLAGRGGRGSGTRHHNGPDQVVVHRPCRGVIGESGGGTSRSVGTRNASNNCTPSHVPSPGVQAAPEVGAVRERSNWVGQYRLVSEHVGRSHERH
jgi:hypothetical protein